MPEGTKIIGSHVLRYILMGAIFGCLFPVLATGFSIMDNGLDWSIESVQYVQRTFTLLWIIDTAPFFLGVFAAIAGIAMEQSEVLRKMTKELKEREGRLKKQNKVLREVAQFDEVVNMDIKGGFARVVQIVSMTLGINKSGIWMICKDNPSCMQCLMLYSDGDCIEPINMKLSNISNKFNDSYYRQIMEGEDLIIEDLYAYDSVDDRGGMRVAEVGKQGIRAILAVPIKLEGQVVGMLSCATTHDTREWFRDEQNFVEALSNFISLLLVGEERNAAEQSDKAKSEFLAVISHELRTPLNVISGFNDLIIDSNPAPAVKDHAQEVKKSASMLMDLVNDVLDLSKLESKRIDIEEQTFSLRDIIEESSLVVKPHAEEKNLEFRVNLDSNMPELFIGDSVRLRQVIINLLTNAVKFTTIGGVALKVFVPKYLESEGQVLAHFDIMDTGPGIKISQQEAIFDLFTQADNTLSRQYGGAGLGLAICKRLVLLMGGDIGVESSQGEGSRFWFEVPLKIADGKIETVTNPENLDIFEEKNLPIKKAADKASWILVVEDEIRNQKFFEVLLKEAGFESTITARGSEALELIREYDYDAIIMDIQIPDMDGIEITKRIRRLDGKKANIPIIGATARAIESEREAALEAGMKACLMKPIDGPQLISLIQESVNR